LKDFSTDPNQPGVYVTPIGLGDKPHILGKQFYIMYTYYPNDGLGRELQCAASQFPAHKEMAERTLSIVPLSHTISENRVAQYAREA
jgi:hypothetical protein